MPAGITRFIIQVVYYVCTLILHASALMSLWSDRKNEWVEALLALKWPRGFVRYYQEPVILLDE